MTPVGFERVDLRLREAELAQQLIVVLPEQRGMPPVDPLRAPREPHRQRAVAGGSDHRMVHLLEEATGLQLGQVGLVVGLHHLAHGHAGAPTGASTISSADRARHHSPRTRVDAVVLPCVRPALVASSGSAAQAGSPSAARRASPTARRWRRRWRPNRRPDRARRARRPCRGSAAPPWDRGCRPARAASRRRRTRSAARRRC